MFDATLMLTVLLTAVLVYTVLVSVRYVLYWSASYYFHHKAGKGLRDLPPGDPSAFTWHFLVPCRDEEVVIAETMDRLRERFPEAHVWVIDDDSDDATGEIVAERADRDARVHLLTRRRPDARVGKGAALNAAYRALNAWLPEGTDRTRHITCVVDADGDLAPGALELLASPRAFGDPELGAAQVGVRMRNAGDTRPLAGQGALANAYAHWLARMQDVEFSAINNGMQLLRERTRSVGLGGNGQFGRLSALDAIAGEDEAPWPPHALLEDYVCGLEMHLAGIKVIHVENTHVSQEGLVTTRRFLTQRTRWAQGNLQCLRYSYRLARSPRIPFAGHLETMYTFTQPLVAAVLAIIAAATLATMAFGPYENPQLSGYDFGRFTLLGLGILLLSAVPIVLWGLRYRVGRYPGERWWVGLLWGVGLWIYAYHLIPVSLRALYRIARGRNGWAKTRRNAELTAVTAPTARED
ncbi:glycosyltransferase [Nocardiopsis potens]|uniref:glycosyltransferase n=1 Tax=Nocardiopsis potens TaxID=1246458 RepID=UPI00034C47F9|nr:glycosyltransferase [Nocardiopsis potens]